MSNVLSAEMKRLFVKSEKISGVFGSLSHPIRLQILCFLIGGEKVVQDLADYCKVPQPVMSQFLARMKRDGLVDSKRDGKRVFYRLKDRKLEKLLLLVRDLYC